MGWVHIGQWIFSISAISHAHIYCYGFNHPYHNVSHLKHANTPLLKYESLWEFETPAKLWFPGSELSK